MSLPIKAECPDCGYEIDDASGLGDANGNRPEAGNVSICIRCAGLAFFEEQDGVLILRVCTPEETAELESIEELVDIRAKVLATSVWMNR